jgi:glycosyltransferase involved in cell wall biosynthesis
MVAAIRRVRSQRAFDLAVVEFTQMAHYIEYLRGIPAILDESDIAFVRRHRFAATTRPPLRWLLRWDTRKLRSYELEHARRFDAILVRTEHDRRFLEGLLPGKRIQVLPPWVDCSFAGQTNGVPLRDVILFYGAMWRPVNEQAAQFLAEKVLPHVRQRRPDVQLVILGSRPGLRVRNLAGRNVVVTGFVPDVSAHYRQCCVAVIPLLSGSGIKGKVVQALACGKPVVTTSVGAEGIPATEEDGLFIRDSAQSIAACVSWLLEDRRYLNYQQPARRFFRKYYDWPGGVRRLLDLCEDLRVS